MMRRSNLFKTVLFAGLAITAACAKDNQKGAAIPPLDLANLDTTCNACDDFYQFANGGWIAKNEIPAEYAQWGSFHELRDRSTETLHSLLDSLVTHKDKLSDPTVVKLASFYQNCMDTVAIEEQGIKPLSAELEAVNALSSEADIRGYINGAHARGSSVLFSYGSTQDYKNSSEVIFVLRQGGLGLPDRDYYLKTDTSTNRILGEYRAHIANLLELSGQSRESALSDANLVIALEKELASNSMTNVERRNPVLTYNKKSFSELKLLAPGFNWENYFEQAGISQTTTINVAQPLFFSKIDGLLKNKKPDVWKAYLRFHLISNAAPRLSKSFADADFDFFQKKLTGTKQQLPRYKQCVAATDAMVGHALGQVYVAKHFPPEAKARAMEMVNNLKEAFRQRLTTRTWMSDSTREQAFAKLNSFNVKIGYPDKWMDYTALKVEPNSSYYATYVSARKFLNDHDLDKIGKPVDKDYWWMTAPTVNAYYSSTRNEIVFPAGILQPPFFDPNADDAVNYGGIGSVIGHEISHGFDDQGSAFDEKGNLRQWFTVADLANFKARTRIVEDQFNNYTILDSLPVNGALTLGENIADLAGVKIAYLALTNTLNGKVKPDKIDGFTPEQRFFLAWAQIWRGKIRDEMARMRLNTDTHSPQKFRTNGPLTNLPEFAEAWGCSEGSPMVRPAEKRAEIW